MINIYDDMMAEMLTDTGKEHLAELMKKLLLNANYSSVMPRPSGTSISGTIPIPMKKPVLCVESLNKNFKINGVRYKRRISFSPYINRPNQSREEMIARSEEVRQFIEDSCLRRYFNGGNTYTFECKQDAALAYLKFA